MKVLLTGSSKGIGYKIAEDLLAEGHELALHYNKNESPLKALLKNDKTSSFSIQADLSNKDEIKSFTHEKKGFFNKFYSLFLKDNEWNIYWVDKI